MSVRGRLLPVFVVVVVANAAWAATKADGGLRGASAVIQSLQPSADAAPAAKKDEIATLLDDLEKYAKAPGAPAAAASRWIELYERWRILRGKVEMSNPEHYDPASQRPLHFGSLLARLPAPEAWPEIAKRLQRVKATGVERAGLDTLGALLSGRATGPVIQRAKAQVEQAPKDERVAARRALATIERLTAADGDPKSLVSLFEKELSERAAQAGSVSRLEAPDLVTLIGSERARALLERAILLPSASLVVPVGDATRELAQDLVVQHWKSLKVPHWNLVRAPKARAVYEAIARQFADATRAVGSDEDRQDTDTDWQSYGANLANNQDRSAAQLHYLVALIAAGEASQAEQLARSLGRSDALEQADAALTDLRRAGYSMQLYRFFATLLDRDPALSLWPTLFDLAAESGKSAEALSMVDRALRRPDLTDAVKRDLKRQRVSALLAADRVQEATSLARDLMLAAESKGDEQAPFRVELAAILIEVGRLLSDNKSLEAGLAQARAELGRAWPDSAAYRQQQLLLDVVKSLRKAGRLAECQEMLVQALRAIDANPQARMAASFGIPNPQQRALLVELVALYHQAGRAADVLSLVGDLPSWGADDLAAVYLLADSGKVPLAFMVAAALGRTGDKARARPILETVIGFNGGFDPAYETYVGLFPDAAPAFFDGIQKRDRFEERPLIWKAVALVAQGKAADAEAIARQAIGIDPSDGEQGANHRMRVYAILADTLQARGQLESAETYRGAVRAIRISEAADELRLAGLHQRAIAQYQRALTE
jgi:hypothetical protein